MATSWAVDDLAATVAKKNPRARVLKFPAIDEDGEALVPELHPLEKLLETKALLSPGQWSALYQQTPIAEGGNVFQEDWIRRWDASTLPPYFEEVIASWDMTSRIRTARTMSSGRSGGGMAQTTICLTRPQTHGLHRLEGGRPVHACPVAADCGGAH